VKASGVFFFGLDLGMGRIPFLTGVLWAWTSWTGAKYWAPYDAQETQFTRKQLDGFRPRYSTGNRKIRSATIYLTNVFLLPATSDIVCKPSPSDKIVYTNRYIGLALID
jgi:hypothetical protein